MVEPDPDFELTPELIEALRKRSVSRNPNRRAASQLGAAVSLRYTSADRRRMTTRRAAAIRETYKLCRDAWRRDEQQSQGQ